jgi:DNA processing protein
MSSLVDELALTFIPGVGGITQRNLIQHFGSARAVIDSSAGMLQEVSGIGKKIAAQILEGRAKAYERAEQEITFARKHQINILCYGDDAYPRRLRECYDAPAVLYYRGNADLNTARMVSVVGTRHATGYGRTLCEQLVEDLVPYGVTVVSGMAYGIDTMAHKSSVAHQVPTIGVMGHGLDQIYPPQNRNLAVDMLRNGGLLSEYPSETMPDRKHFPQRNRIIAGMTDVSVVVEAAVRGGALITAEIANNYNRDVCAFPGNVHLPFSSGCNLLIKSHRAHLITGAKDLAYLMDWQAQVTPVAPAPVALAGNEKFLHDLLIGHEQLGIEDIAVLSGIPPGKLAIHLLELEMKGLVITMPGKLFRSTHRALK